MDHPVYWVWLQQVLGYGSPKTEQLLNAYGGSARAVCEAGSEELCRKGILTRKQMELLQGTSLQSAEKILENCAQVGCRVITCDSDEYPEALRQICGRPLVLYVLGDLSCMKEKLAIGIVGTRRNSEYGRNAADLLSRQLASCGVVVVSGMAAGIDTVAHTGAMKGGGKTVAVLGCGVDITYPPQNETLKELIVQNGAVVSEFPPGTQPIGTNFPIRNRIVSGLSSGIVVVEGRRRSGSLITAGHALAQGRDVFAVPGSIFEGGTAGPHWLISQGAIPVTCTRDILEEYLSVYSDKIDIKTMEGLSMPNAAQPGRKADPLPPPKEKKPPERAKKRQTPPAEPIKPTAPLFLNELQRRLYDQMEEQPKSVDLLTQSLGFPVNQVLAALTQLEIYGLVQALPGHNYIYSKEG